MSLIIHLDKLREIPKPFEGELTPEELDLLAVDGVVEPSPVAYNLRANIAGTEVLIIGQVSWPIRLECVKCAQKFDSTLQIKDFVRSYSLDDVPESLELVPELREELLLTFPTFPQCSAACSGLCPVCGINLNRETCECVTTKTDHRWGALDSLNLGTTPRSNDDGPAKT